MTKEQLSQYIYIKDSIEVTKNKIKYYEDRPPKIQYGKVYGSCREYPYTKRSFNLSGYNGADADKWNRRISELKQKLSEQLMHLELERVEIEEFINDIPDLCTRLIFTYIYIDGMRQEEVAKKLCMERSTISKRITSCLGRINSETGCP